MNGLDEMYTVLFVDMILEHNKKYIIYLILYLLYVSIIKKDQLMQDQLGED